MTRPRGPGGSLGAHAADGWEPHWMPDLLEAARDHRVTIARASHPPRDRWWTSNGLDLHGLDWGTPGQAPMLCLHGGGQQAHCWDFFALAMRSEFHVIAVDLRGHGDSDWSPERDYRLPTLAADVHRILNQQGFDRVSLVGLSLGGLTALTLAGTYPDMVRALVLVDVGMELHRDGVDRIRRFASGPQRFDDLESLVERAHAFNPRRAKRHLRSSLLHNLRRDERGGWTWKYDNDFPGDVDPAELIDVPAVLRLAERISAPTLLVRGADSDVQSEEGAVLLEQRIPNATRIAIPSAGHTVMGDNPRGFEDAVRNWLTARLADSHG